MSQNTTQPDARGAVDFNLPPDPSRRTWVATACALGGVAGVATAVPFVSSFAPSEKAKAAGAPVEVDISNIAPGQMRTVEWRGKPVWILHRTQEQLDALPKLDSQLADPDSDRPGYTPAYAKNEYRSRRPEIFICIGICTHLGCSPTPHLAAGAGAGLPGGWEGGFLCPCHGSTFDLAGRVYSNKPAPDNLEIPPYEFSADGTMVTIGVDENNKA
ncbi:MULTISPECIES: ubiquinol-cytochrome c reductase iron-sulfur subunit [Alcaligenes]|jgi:ubiquinol-cytochrome c reductase iron-sulfur subunit|uniref:Ubiquinol-cytochrome c reductase iron-sulfur subunit n=2 Tax=Alcaligenes TaxID=507 RepID=A0A3G2HZ73_9BURK|nr:MULTISPECIES: ubiquinol-cytochrome c reductase iron-sulfur subunit [Alcaligenes]ASR91049.1 ubiquinol-cytochrome c reductase iron-sulfur subunit [Alcaligenes faecalis]AWG36282.1 ubiquinol-cytochrome c reductase iron-sulfur subunit [Alcaligenes aquatilis]AYN22355.1 ubiquinol-cytochrome c reductase iron-sulfur subunit [Alcaligenes aquatilis]MCC9164699.1 ubiquinol-cytochrome c reductase iron-sulfur subunit [Alcaligenes sp. MMA]QXR35714.1 ubiquinol-cytochrome c reductase iron-sulfur subunit [Alc